MSDEIIPDPLYLLFIPYRPIQQMATNSNIYRYPLYGVPAVPAYPQQQPIYNGMPYPPLQIGYPQPPTMYYSQYQQHPIMTSPPNMFPSDAILFYDDNKPYYEMTNFARFGFDLDGDYWPTSEHYFQAQKFDGYPLKKSQVRRLAAPRDAFDFVRRPENKAVSYLQNILVNTIVIICSYYP